MSEEIKKLKAAIASKYTPEASKAKLQARLDALEEKAKPVPVAKKVADPKPKAKRTGGNQGTAGADRLKLAGEIHKAEKKNGMKWAEAVKEASRRIKTGDTKSAPKPKGKKIARKVAAVKPKAKKFVRKAKPVAKKVGKKIVKMRATKDYDKKKDKTIKALKPGKRISREGNTYYETRRNRADLNRTTKL